MTCDSALEVCGAHSVHQVLDQRLTRPEEVSDEEEKKEEVAEEKVTLLDALKALEVARQCIFQLDMEDKLENELHRQTVNEKEITNNTY
jgi:hypothetical protein